MESDGGVSRFYEAERCLCCNADCGQRYCLKCRLNDCSPLGPCKAGGIANGP